MDGEIKNIIEIACLKHADSGEMSKSREALLILKALNDNGYRIVKSVDLANVGKSCNHQYISFGCGFDKVCKVCGIVAPVE